MCTESNITIAVGVESFSSPTTSVSPRILDLAAPNSRNEQSKVEDRPRILPGTRQIFSKRVRARWKDATWHIRAFSQWAYLVYVNVIVVRWIMGKRSEYGRVLVEIAWKFKGLSRNRVRLSWFISNIFNCIDKKILNFHFCARYYFILKVTIFWTLKVHNSIAFKCYCMAFSSSICGCINYRLILIAINS